MYLQIATLLTLAYATFYAFAMLNGKPKGGQELSRVWLGRNHDPLHTEFRTNQMALQCSTLGMCSLHWPDPSRVNII
jgi:hypothetical protein